MHVRAQQRQAGDTTLHGVIYSYMPRTVSGGRRVCAALTAERTELSEAGGGELGAAGDRDEAGGADSPSNGVRKLSQKHAAESQKRARAHKKGAETARRSAISGEHRSEERRAMQF